MWDKKLYRHIPISTYDGNILAKVDLLQTKVDYG